MNTRDIAAEYRLRHWAGVMHECKESGLSVKLFCKDNGIHTNTYYYWQKKLREAACTELAKTTGIMQPVCADGGNAAPKAMASAGQVPVVWANISAKDLSVTATPGAGNIIISRDGWTVKVEAGTDAALLAEALKAVSRACC